MSQNKGIYSVELTLKRYR